MVQQRRAALSVLALVVCVAAFLVAQLVSAGASRGQVLPTSTTTTPTTATTTSSTTPSTTAPPATTTPPTSAPATTAPATTVPAPPTSIPGEDPIGDGGDEGTTGSVPADAQSIIDAYPRSAPNNSKALLTAVQPLVDLGVTREEAIRLGFGSFPIAGDANFVDDWLFPRFGPGFRFHKGTDMFAPYGTPLRSVADGVATSTNNGLGGLAVRVTIPDGTYFYYAHLSALPEDFVDGMAVKVGDIVGYVGDSGNARGGSPHLHFGVYLRGGEAVNPKPYLDQWIADAMARLPEVTAQVKASQTEASSMAAQVAAARGRRSLLATSLLRSVAERSAAGAVPTGILYQASANPSTGGVAVAESEATRLAASVDWEARAAAAELSEAMVERLLALSRAVAGPLASPEGD